MPKAVLQIVVDQPSVSGGDLVTGCVTVQAHKPLARKSFTLTVTGRERVRWLEESGEGSWTEQHEDEWFKTLIVLSDQSTIGPGQCVFPFQFRLPEYAPTSYQRRAWGYEFTAINECKLEATLKHSGFLRTTARASSAILVRACNEAVPVPQPVEQSATRNPHFMMVRKSGECSLDAWVDRNKFVEGEATHVQCAIWNESDRLVRTVVLELVEFVHVVKNGSTKFRMERVVTQHHFGGVAKGETMEKLLPFTFAPNVPVLKHLTPSTRGVLYVRSFMLRVTCDIAYGRNVSVNMPITIVAA